MPGTAHANEVEVWNGSVNSGGSNPYIATDSDNWNEFKNALLMAEKALELDSTYALTYAVLAWVHENGGWRLVSHHAAPVPEESDY